MEELKQTYGKVEVARGHLEVAIENFFNDRPPATIHLLASAAFAILRDLPACKESNFLNQAKDLIKEGHEKEFYWYMNRHYNFFKHAKDDANDVIEFDERASDILILQATVLLGIVEKTPHVHSISFQTWFYLAYPELCNFPQPMKDIIENQIKENNVKNLSRAELKALGKNLHKAQLIRQLGGIF